MLIRKCIVCGKEFEAITNQTSCSPECRKIRSREVSREYQKRYKQADGLHGHGRDYHREKHAPRKYKERDPFRGLVEHRKTNEAIKQSRKKLSDISKKAKEMGLTYGEYMSRYGG